MARQQAPASAQVHRYQDSSAAVAAFLSGQTQFLATGNIVGATLLADNPERHFEQKLQLMNSPVCAAVRKGDGPMLAEMNQIFATLKQQNKLQHLSLDWLKQPL